MLKNLDGLLWLLLFLGPILVLQRSLHREIQIIFLLLTRRGEIAVALFSFLLLPGVLLHEGSHYLMAKLLGVRTGRVSILPRPLENGRLQLGFVETAPTDWLRDALVGAAPLLTGSVVVAYIGLGQLNLPAVWEQLVSGGLAVLSGVVAALIEHPDFWLWFYLVVAVSSTMLPSASDRRSWLPIGLILLLFLAVMLLAGAGSWLEVHLSGPVNQALKALAMVFAIGVSFHLVLLPPLWIFHRLLSALFKVDAV